MEWQLACRGAQSEAVRKHIENKNLSYDEMQSLPAWEIQHFPGSYQEQGVGIGYRREDIMGKQGVENIRRISIGKDEERIQTNTYIFTFNQLRTPKEVKIGYGLERIEQHVPASLRCFKCRKYGYHREACAKCSEKDPDHVEEDCLKEIRCANRQQNHPAYPRSCVVYQKEKEIIEVKNNRNVSFLEARKIVGSYMGENSYATNARRVDTTNQNKKYRILVKKLIQLEANDWPKFQEHLKKLHSVEFYPAPAWQPLGNGERSIVVVKTKTHVGSTTPTQTTLKSAKSPAKQTLHKSPIRPPKSIKDRPKDFSSNKTRTTYTNIPSSH